MKPFILCSLTALALAACANHGSNKASPQPTDKRPLPAPDAASSLPDHHFTCRNGMSLTVKYNVGADKIRLFVNTIPSSSILSIAPSGSGNRYVNQNGFYNQPTEFHYKGNQAHLSLTDATQKVIKTTCSSK